MGKDVDQVQTQCETYQLAVDRVESYVVFASKDWRSSFTQYLTEGVHVVLNRRYLAAKAQ